MKIRKPLVLVSLIVVALLLSSAFSGCVLSTPLTPPAPAVAPEEIVEAPDIEPEETVEAPSPEPEEVPEPPSAMPVLPLYDEEAIIRLYNQVIPAVVEIRTLVGSIGSGQGSGFVIDDEGHILTNNHVVEGATSVDVILHSGDRLEAQVVGTDRENDLALLKIDTEKISNVSPLPLGDSDKVRPGQMAIALGSPFGLEGSITVGIISGLGRALTGAQARSITNLLQTDAAINPGNSGGPLLDSNGEVIGINTAIEASSTGIGFAIPINTAESLLPALLQGGEVSTPWLGISGTEINQALATELNLPTDQGVYVVSVVPESPAERAGIIPGGSDQDGPTSGGDIITEVDGQPVTTVADLLQYFNTKQVGEQVALTVIRGDETITVEVTLDEWPTEIP